MKRILILGGTQFIGRNVVELLLQETDFAITLFNRQRTQPQLFPEVARIKGDRETNDIDQLKNTDWDVVVDISSYHPNSLRQLMKVLRGRVGRYIYVSTISVYDWQAGQELMTEETPLLSCSDEQAADTGITAANYGAKKAECERVLLAENNLDTVLLRPSVVYGAYDPTDRFYYWLHQCQRQQPVLLPDSGMHSITITYVKDLARILLRAMQLPAHNTTYNTTTHTPVPFRELISMMGCQQPLSISTEQINRLELKPGSDLPMWFGGPLRVNNQKLISDFGFHFTPLQESITQTRAFYESRQWPAPKVGLQNERLQAILQQL